MEVGECAPSVLGWDGRWAADIRAEIGARLEEARRRSAKTKICWCRDPFCLHVKRTMYVSMVRRSTLLAAAGLEHARPRETWPILALRLAISACCMG